MRTCNVFATLVVMLMIAIAPQPPCLFQNGNHVTLLSPLDDPHVLLWSTKLVLTDYLQGKWDGFKVLRATYLLDPSTKAVVESACPNGNRDIIGVRVRSGPHTGAFGWVDTHDVRP